MFEGLDLKKKYLSDLQNENYIKMIYLIKYFIFNIYLKTQKKNHTNFYFSGLPIIFNPKNAINRNNIPNPNKIQILVHILSLKSYSFNG